MLNSPRRFVDISRIPVYWDARDLLVSQDPAYIQAGQVPNLYGPDAIFLDTMTGMPATYYDVRAWYTP